MIFSKLVTLIICHFVLGIAAQAETISREQLSDLHKIRSEIKNAVFEQSRYKQDIIKSTIDIEIQNQQILQNQTEAEQIKEQILDRITSLYKIRRAYPNGSVLSFAKEEDFLRKSYYLKYLNTQDKKLAKDYQLKTELTRKLKQKLQSYMNRLIELQKKSESRFAELKNQEETQRNLIRQIRESVNVNIGGGTVASNDKKFFSEQRGQLNLPIVGEVTGQIGFLREPKSKLAFLKTGLNIEPKNSSDLSVESISDGQVLHTDSIPGWGPTIIIDHGESYYSIYSHLKNLSVRPGDHVIAKQKLAEVSRVAYHKSYDEPGLYFEIRHYSEPEDPRLWLKGELE